MEKRNRSWEIDPRFPHPPLAPKKKLGDASAHLLRGVVIAAHLPPAGPAKVFVVPVEGN